jgi:hypothetical protein
MNILWLTSSTVTVLENGWYAPMASARYRLSIPAQALVQIGHKVTVVTLAELERDPEKVLEFGRGYDVVIFSKVFHALTLQLLVTASQHGARTIYDLCDNHFDESRNGTFLRNFLLRVDSVVCSTQAMANLIADETGRNAVVIGDPVEGPLGRVKERPNEGVFRLAWFGHPVNLDTLQAQLTELSDLARTMPLHLTVVTDANSGFDVFTDYFNRQVNSPLQIRFVPWSLSATWQELQDCDAVIIPSFVDDRRKSVKSANRVTECLQAGRAVIAHSLPSYIEFGEWIWLGERLVEGVTWTAQQFDNVAARTRVGQSYVQENYNATVIGQQWHRVFQAGYRVRVGCLKNV